MEVFLPVRRALDSIECRGIITIQNHRKRCHKADIPGVDPLFLHCHVVDGEGDLGLEIVFVSLRSRLGGNIPYYHG